MTKHDGGNDVSNFVSLLT